MDVCISCLQSTFGRMLRVVFGLVVVAIGILFLQGTAGFLVAVLGLIPICAALSGECLMCPPLWVYIRRTEEGETWELVMS
jgi:Inner membrane protein YgaP-like, transmembrane domain